jgi:hypothetical protein
MKGHLTAKQQEPMEKLLKLEGLHRVKQHALDIYNDVLADARLTREGFASSISPRTLNFVFSGNPGEPGRGAGKPRRPAPSS